MLIDLFIHESEGKKVATSALCLASTAPPSTALRLVNKLCEAKLLVKIDDHDDGRRQFVELTPDTAARLENYFGADEGGMQEGGGGVWKWVGRATRGGEGDQGRG